MKRKSLWAAAALSLAAASVFAQGASMPGADRREARQERRIEQGVNSGALTPRESARLERQQKRIEDVETRAEADGKVTPKERAHLARMQDRESRHIRRQKHDRQHR